MIKGIGIDIVEKNRIKINNTSFLSPQEILIFNTKSQVHKINFLAGRWAAKEALYKAWKNCPKIFPQITILNDKNDSPYLKGHKNIKISISHEKQFTIAFCVVE